MEMDVYGNVYCMYGNGGTQKPSSTPLTIKVLQI